MDNVIPSPVAGDRLIWMLKWGHPHNKPTEGRDVTNVPFPMIYSLPIIFPFHALHPRNIMFVPQELDGKEQQRDFEMTDWWPGGCGKPILGGFSRP